jgi:hypothetical protein
MQKFSEFVNEQKAILESKAHEDKAAKFTELYEAKLKEMGAKSPLDLSEEDSKVFFEYLKNLKEEIKADEKKADKVEEADEVTDEKSFREYATSVLKKAHPKDFDQKIADKVINDLAAEVKDGDWGAAVGKLTSGLGK